MGFARVGSNPTVVDLFLFPVAAICRSGPSGAMDSASDFGSGGWGFESPLGLFFWWSFFFSLVSLCVAPVVYCAPVLVCVSFFFFFFGW